MSADVMKSEKVVKDIERRSVVVDGMSQEEQDIATAIELAPVSDRGERRELLRLFRQRRGPKKKRVSGPFSRKEQELVERGEGVLALIWESHRVQAAERAAAKVEADRRLKEAARIAARARQRAEHLRIVAEFAESLSEEFPHWSAEAVQRCASRGAQRQEQRWFQVLQFKKRKRGEFPRLRQAGSQRIQPGPDFSCLPREQSAEDLEARYGAGGRQEGNVV